jgi:hypothetical protein
VLAAIVEEGSAETVVELAVDFHQRLVRWPNESYRSASLFRRRRAPKPVDWFVSALKNLVELQLLYETKTRDSIAWPVFRIKLKHVLFLCLVTGLGDLQPGEYRFRAAFIKDYRSIMIRARWRLEVL